jgi:hypothetical protein
MREGARQGATNTNPNDNIARCRGYRYIRYSPDYQYSAVFQTKVDVPLWLDFLGLGSKISGVFPGQADGTDFFGSGSSGRSDLFWR